MSKHQKYVPKHRSVPERTPRRALPSAVRTGLAMTSVAAAVTGIAVVGGTLGSGGPDPLATTAHEQTDDGAATQTGGEVAARAATSLAAARERVSVSRSAARRADPAKASLLSTDSGPARTASVDLSDGDPRDIARALLPQFGFGADQFGCLDSLWMRESHWNPAAHNRSSGAHGIPQALPGSKMASAGPDWATNPVTQITWGLGYIRDRYGSPCSAWGHSQSRGWY